MLWDSVLTEFNMDLDSPLSDDDWTFLSEHANRIRQSYPPESLTGLFELARTKWFEEGIEVSTQFVYAGGLDYEN